MHHIGWRLSPIQGWETCLRMIVCLVFLMVSSLGAAGLSGAAETEERAVAECECLLETAEEARVELREDRSSPACEVSYLRAVRLAGNRLTNHGRGRIRCCETAPLPLRC